MLIRKAHTAKQKGCFKLLKWGLWRGAKAEKVVIFGFSQLDERPWAIMGAF
jgi:hypothetical protein